MSTTNGKWLHDQLGVLWTSLQTWVCMMEIWYDLGARPNCTELDH